jgi:hypothetical protein
MLWKWRPVMKTDKNGFIEYEGSLQFGMHKIHCKGYRNYALFLGREGKHAVTIHFHPAANEYVMSTESEMSVGEEMMRAAIKYMNIYKFRVRRRQWQSIERNKRLVELKNE